MFREKIKSRNWEEETRSSLYTVSSIGCNSDKCRDDSIISVFVTRHTKDKIVYI